MFRFNAVLVCSLGIFIQSHLVKSFVVVPNSWNLVSIGINLFLAESCKSGRTPPLFTMLIPDDGIQPLLEGDGGDVGNQETQTMNAELLEDDIRRAQTVDTVAGIEALRMTPHELS